MFAKKLLSIISLLFIGSKIASVSATCTITLKSEQNECEMKSGSDSCNDGYYAITGNADTDVEANTVSASGKLILLSEEKTKCDIIDKIGYFISGDGTTYLSNGANGAAIEEPNGSGCAVGKIKEGGNSLCLDTGTAATDIIDFSTEAAYLVNGEIGVFTGNTKKVIKSDGISAITLSDLEDGHDYLLIDRIGELDSTKAKSLSVSYTEKGTIFEKNVEFNEGDNYDYCVDDKREIYLDRRVSLCDSSSECRYYHCTSGECTPSSSNLERRTDTCDNTSTCITMNKGDGYYLVDKDGSSYALEEGSDAGDLWSCSGSSCSKLSTNDIPLGYLVSKGGITDNPYIKCERTMTGKDCKLVEISSDGTCNGVGVLYSTETKTKYNICLDTANGGISIDLTTDELTAAKRGDNIVDSKGQYMISIESTLFGITAQPNHFIVLEVDAVGNVIVKKETTTIRYRYTDGNGANKYKLFSRSEAQSATGDDNGNGKNQICKASTENKAFEYTKDQWTSALENDTEVDYYVEGVNDA